MFQWVIDLFISIGSALLEEIAKRRDARKRRKQHRRGTAE